MQHSPRIVWYVGKLHRKIVSRSITKQGDTAGVDIWNPGFYVGSNTHASSLSLLLFLLIVPLSILSLFLILSLFRLLCLPFFLQCLFFLLLHFCTSPPIFILLSFFFAFIILVLSCSFCFFFDFSLNLLVIICHINVIWHKATIMRHLIMIEVIAVVKTYKTNLFTNVQLKCWLILEQVNHRWII